MATYKFNLSKDQPIESAATPAKESATTRKRKMTGVEYLGAKTATGLVSGIENVWDFAAGGIADLFGADEWAEKQMSKDWFGDWYGRADSIYDAGNGWKVAGDVTGAIGQMAPSILLALALQAIPAVGQAAGGTLLAATPAIASSATMGLSAAGGATKEAFSQSGNLSGKEWLYGTLVGTTEGAVELASAGLAKGSGKIISGAYNLLSKQAAKTATSTLGKTTMKSMFSAAMRAGKSIAGDFAWEAMEEGVAEILAPMYAQLTYNPNAQNATAQEVAYAALVGGLTGLVMSGANGAISTSWNHAKALSLGNKLVSTNGVQGTLRNAQLIAQYQAENDTDIEAFKAVAKGYAELAADIGSSTELTAGQKMRLGELSRNISAAAFSTSIYRSAQAYTDNAEALSARINSLGLTGIDGKPVTVGVEDILRGIDKSDLTSEQGKRRYQKSIQRAISENPILSYLAINDAVGHMLTDSTMLAAEMATGDAPITRSNLNALIERGSQQNIDAVASLFNVTSDELVRMSPSELDELGMYHAFTAEGQKTYNVNRMYQEAIRNKDELRVSSVTTVRAAMKDGMFRINRGKADVAVIKDGDLFYLYDYNSKNRSRALTAQEANAVIKDLIGEGVSTETARTKTKYQEETESIEKFARDNIKGYRNLTPAVKEYVRMTIRDARAHGKSDQISALIAKVAMRTGLPILFDGDVTGSSNAIYRSSTIYLNPSLEDGKVYTMLLAHEFGHAIKDLTIAGDKFFDRIAEMIFDENGKVKSTIITQKEVDDLKKRYTEFELSRGRTEEKAAEIAKEEIVTAYMEKVVRSKKTWEYVLGEKPSFKEKVLSFFRKAEADYSTEPRMNAEARKFLKYYKKMFAELEAASIDQSKRKPKGDDSSIRNSISSFAKAAGISAERNPETGRIEFRDKDGNLLSADDITAEHAKDSGLGLMISLAVENNNITKAEAKKQYEGIADLLRLILRTQDPDLVWQFAGATMFSSVKANSDAQYTTTIDFSTVCRKTQEMIDEMTITMKKIGRGLTRSEVVELQRRTIEEGGTVNCPVCYVFSRWVGIGGVLDNIRQMQDKYEKYNTEELNAALRETFNRMTSTVKELAKKNGKRNTTVITQLLSEKSERLTTIISELEGLKATKAKKTSDGHSIAETVKKMEAELAELQIEVDVLSEYSWLKTVRLKKNYKPVPVDVLYDLSDPAEFAEKYKDSWKYRTTRGPGAGKAILPYSDARLGDIISGAKVKAITDEEGTEIVTRNKTWEEIGSEFTKAQRESIKRALIKQLAQNIIGGQRMQSTSDFRYDYALDYVLSFFEMQAIGSNIQTYTKMVEFADFVASVGGDVNLSLMPLDAGYKDGKLIFSAVTGMNFEAAKEARAKHDSVQTILVGINDEHIRLALLDSEETLGAYVDFVIPYHASGASQDLIKALVTNLGEKYNKKNYVDYSKLQSDKSWEDSKLTDEILELRAIRQYILTGKVSTKNPDTGKTSSKDAPIPPRFLEVIQQMNDKRVDISKKSFAVLRAIEKKALAGDPKAIETYKSWSAGVLYDTYVRLRQGDYTADGKKVAMRARLSASQAKAIMPHEYWDRNSTRKNAYINGFIFRSYCYSLGMTPRFSGMTIKDVFFGDFTNETGYWKTLIDRAMYDLEGRYRDQQKCRVTNFQTEMVLPSWADRVYPKYKVQEPSYQRSMRIANQFADEIIERERGGIDEVVVEERHSLGDSAGEYRYRSASVIYDLKEGTDLTEMWREHNATTADTSERHSLGDTATEEASDLVSHMKGIVKERGSWRTSDLFSYVDEHPNLNFIDRIFNKDKTVKKDLEEFLNGIDDEETVDLFGWYMAQGYGDKDSGFDYKQWKNTYPYRGAVRTFQNAIKKRRNELLTLKVGGTNLGVKNGEVSLGEIRNLFRRLNSNDDLGALADKVFATAERLGVNIRFANQVFISSGRVFGDAMGDMVELKTSYFNDTAYSDQHKAETILHEVIHACTVYAIDLENEKKHYFGYLSSYAKRLNYIHHAIEVDPSFRDQYGIKDTHEMVAEFSNPEFVELLKKKSLWQHVLDFICELFGFTRGTSAYENAKMCLDYILDNPDVTAYKQYALEARKEAHRIGKAFGYTEMDDGTRYSLPADEQSARMLAAQNARLRKRNAQLTQENRESRAFANNLLAVKDKAKKLIDKKNGAFLRAFEIPSEEPKSHPIYTFASGILNQGKLVGPQSIRDHAKALLDWYRSGETIEILGKATESTWGLWREDIVEKLKDIIGKDTQSGNSTGVPLTAKQLGELAKILSYLGKISENLTKRHRRGNVIELAGESVRLKGIIDQNQALGIKPLRMGGYLRGNLDPASVARKLDGYVSGGFFTDTYEDMRRGVIDSGVAHMRMLDAYEAFLKDNKRYLDTARTSKVTVKVGKTEYSLTRMELISLYLTTKRQQAFKGLVKNGFVIRRPMDKRVVEKLDRHKDYEVYKVQGLAVGFKGTKEELAKIVGDFSKKLESLLTESDKKYVAILEEIYNTKCKELKKKTDLARFGYSNVIQGFYYPVRRYLTRSIQGEVTIQQELEFVGSASFNKDTVQGASSQLLIEDADSLMHRHSKAVCNYAYLAEALDTYNRLLMINAENVTTEQNGVKVTKAEVVRSGEPISLRAKIDDAMGASVLEYFNSLWVSAQGGTNIEEGEGSKVFNALRGGYAVAALAGNPKVLVTQTTSLIAACNLIDADCIAKTIFRSGSGTDEYCPLAALRNHDSEAVAAMTNAERTSTIVKVQGATMRFGNALMKPIAGMDRLVITRLFAACQEQIAKDNKGNEELKVGTKKNLEEAGKLLERVILETQQNALPTERSSWMRDGNAITKTLTMFSADAMKSFGRFFDAASEFNALKKRLKANPNDADLLAQRKEAGKRAAKAGGVIVAQSVYMTLISQAFKYLYAKDDDDRKLGWAMVLDTIGGLFSGLPLVRDIVDFFINKYSIDNFAFETLNGVLEGITNLLDSCEKVIKGEDNGEFMNKAVKNLSFMVGTALGLPVRNIYNLLNGLARRIGGKDVAYRIDSLFSQQSYANDLEEAIKSDDIDLANTIVDVALEKYLGQDVDDTVAEEIRRANRSYKFFPASPYTSEAFKELSAAEKEQFKDVYSGSISDVKSFIRSKKYYKLSEEERGKIIDYIFDTYYDAAMVSVARKSVSKSEMKKVVASRYIDLVVLAEVDTTTGNKQERAKAVNSLSVSDEEKLFIYALKYKLTDKNEQKLLRSYINNLAATNEEKALILEFCQLND